MVETIVQGHEVSGRAVIQNQGDCWQSPWSYGVLGPAVLQLLQTRGDPLPVFVFNSWSSVFRKVFAETPDPKEGGRGCWLFRLR